MTKYCKKGLQYGAANKLMGIFETCDDSNEPMIYQLLIWFNNLPQSGRLWSNTDRKCLNYYLIQKLKIC